ncbi:MAG: hypothetical protein C0467_25535 [Planctomycetaceae bacterium]|nr:hypothetical protein [Planctomycetaceae bacterium]
MVSRPSSGCFRGPLMAANAGQAVLRQLRFVVASWKEDRRTDVELLQHFIDSRDEQAFATLVGRHSELLWGVCQRVLRNPADAEDALQATFLRLARDASRIVKREALAGWLFRVARDCAIDLRRSIARQRRIEARMCEVVSQADETPSNDLRILLYDELALLSPSERAVLVLVCLEGRTYASVALELRCSVAAVHRRLVRAQDRLRTRFARHGVPAVAMLSGLIAVGGVCESAAAAPPLVLARVVDSGLTLARTGIVPTSRAGALCAGTHGAISFGRVAAVLGVMAATLVVGLAASRTDVAEPVRHVPLVSAPAPTQQAEISDAPTSEVRGVVRGPNGNPMPGARVVALARQPFGPSERGLRDEVLASTTADAEGRFTLRVRDDFATWLPDRVVTVQASAQGMAPATVPIRFPGETGTEVRLEAATPLRGRLIGPNGEPAVGVRVDVARVGGAVAEPVVGGTDRQLPPGWPDAATTDRDGQFSLPDLGGAANVWVRVADPRFAFETFRVDPQAAKGFQLEAAHVLNIEVVAADTGLPLPGARMTVITDRVGSHPHFCATEHMVLGPHTLPADIDAVADAQGVVRVGVSRTDKVELLVHPPAGVRYVGVRKRLEPGSAGEKLVVRMPVGRWVTGTVVDGDTGRPLAGAAVHWGRETSTQPEWKADVVSGRDAVTRTEADGTFRLPVLPGACSVRVYGPSLDYPSVSTRLAATGNITLFAHNITVVEVSETEDPPPIRAVLRKATAVTGSVESPAGVKASGAFLLCSGRVSPVRGYAGLPLPSRDGQFVVPGCRLEHTTRAYLLDPNAKHGAVVDVSPRADKSVVAKLAPCGAIRLRVVSEDGQPRANQTVTVSLLLDRDRPVNEPLTHEPVADAQPAEWFDAVNYPRRPKTDAKGRVELPALIPGARYLVAVGVGEARVKVGHFTVEPGQTLTLPDVVFSNPAEEGQR